MSHLGLLTVTIPNIWKNKKCSKPPTRIALDVDIGQKWSKHGQKLIDKMDGFDNKKRPKFVAP